MREKTVIRTEQYACPKCDRSVTFKYYEVQSFADEIEEPILKVRDKIIDYGRCQLAAEAAIPHHPIQSEIEDCPFYMEL